MIQCTCNECGMTQDMIIDRKVRMAVMLRLCIVLSSHRCRRPGETFQKSLDAIFYGMNVSQRLHSSTINTYKAW